MMNIRFEWKIPGGLILSLIFEIPTLKYFGWYYQFWPIYYWDTRKIDFTDERYSERFDNVKILITYILC